MNCLTENCPHTDLNNVDYFSLSDFGSERVHNLHSKALLSNIFSNSEELKISHLKVAKLSCDSFGVM